MIWQAIYEGGVFKPTGPVDLSEGSAVTVAAADESADAVELHRLKVFELLSQSFDTERPDLAARHNEHQP